MFITLLISILSLLAFPSASMAIDGAYLYQPEFTQQGQQYLELLSKVETDDLQTLPTDQQTACIKRYSKILSSEIIDIKIALGYFDWTTGSSVLNYGISPSIDPAGYSALRDLLLRPCYGNLRFCGFTQSEGDPTLFERQVKIFGKNYSVRLELHFSSFSEFYYNNTDTYKKQQLQKSQSMDDWFADALKKSNAVFYFGHSRNGGGPDFYPPRLNATQRVNYDYYETYKPGLKKLLTDLQNPKQQTPVLGLMSCASREHFLKYLRNIAPGTGLITSTAVVQVQDVYTAMLGAIDALLRGQCQKSFYHEIRMISDNQENITMDGMFQ